MSLEKNMYMTADMISAIAKSRIYDLGQPLQMGLPNYPSHPPYFFSLMRRHGDLVREGGRSVCNEVIMLSGHVGTHLDGLGHVSVNGKLHGDLPVSEYMDDSGIRGVGMETVPPFICRGVLLDVAGYKGVESLAADDAVTADDLQDCAEAQGVTVKEGDTVLIRTGWIRYWNDSRAYLGLDNGHPGLDVSAAEWLAQKRIRVAGNDTTGFELLRPGLNSLPVHAVLLVEEGIHIIEMVNLEELAADKVYSFLFIVSPLKIVGATGSPVRPLAIPFVEPH